MGMGNGCEDVTVWMLTGGTAQLTFFPCMVLGINLRALHMIGKPSTTEPHPQPATHL
jgi:hypothetical protein